MSLVYVRDHHLAFYDTFKRLKRHPPHAWYLHGASSADDVLDTALFLALNVPIEFTMEVTDP